MEKRCLWIGVMILVLLDISSPRAAAMAARTQKDELVQPVPFTDVRITDEFWSPRLETNRKVTIPYAFKKCEETGRISNFAKAGGLIEGEFEGKYFNDSDVYKVIEGAAYSLKVHPGEALEKYVDGVIEKIAAAQWEDGYLYTFYSLPSRQPEKRWTNIRVRHELYCAGHLFEAAVAYYQATGKRKILDVAIKLADYINSVFGPDKKHDAPGHEEIEIGLVKLYRATGDDKYLKLAKFFLDERGRRHGRKLYGQYCQDHKPVIEQNEAVGHAVRATYMYSGMVDIAALTGDAGYVKAVDRIWENVISKKLYLTGGVGARDKGEAFGDNYELPNSTAYNETCAAIGNAIWNHRLFLLHGDAKYIDVLERIIYNGFLSGVSMSGDRFFYPNPLESEGYRRSFWFGCACCPTNVVRFVASLPRYVYALREDTLYVNLFIQGSGVVKLANSTVHVKQETRYPWEGAVKLTVEPQHSGLFTMNVRIPGWARGRPVPSDLYRYMNNTEEKVTLAVNGKAVALNIENGFASIRRRWKKGDVVELNLPMTVRRVLCHDQVEGNRGQVALERGPMVYCAEWLDNGGHVRNLVLSDNAALKAEYREDLLKGISVVRGKVPALYLDEGGNSVVTKEQEFLAIPYYAWSHRGNGEMAVWLPRSQSLAKPVFAGALKADSFKYHVDFFNGMEKENMVNYISNSQSWRWMKNNVPLFECPDKSFEQIYYFRWWTYRKHIKQSPDGFVLTEFLAPVGHAGVYNTISCALGHHIYEGRWLHDQQYMDEYSLFWYRRNKGGPQRHFHRYSNWVTDALYNRYLVNLDKGIIRELLDDFIFDHEQWEKERLLDNGLFWQYDVLDGMEESISGARRKKNARPPLNSYMYASAKAISRVAEMGGRKDAAREYADKAARLKSLVQNLLWNDEARFFEVRHEDGKLADVREEIGLIPWYFNLPDAGYEQAWLQILDPAGFKAPMGLMTAERRHPDFRSHGVGTCEWDGAVWPFATTQSLVGLANVLRNYEQAYVTRQDYFEALTTYARSHRRKGKPYIGEYLDEMTGQWLTKDSDRSRYYNHSGFCDLVITGLVGLVPREDDIVEVNPLLPEDTWQWFCLDNVRYHDYVITILWDQTGDKYGKGKGLRVFGDGKEIAASNSLARITGQLP